MTGPARLFEIRPARPAEYEAVGEICVLAYGALEGETDLGYHEELRNVAGRAALVDVLVAAEPHGPLLGTVTYVPGSGPLSESEREDEAGFRMLAVAPWAQGRGVGRALVEACIERARADEKGGLAIYTRPSMRMAHRLYGSLGFERDKASDWEFEPGEWLWGFRLRF
ncbi:MAG: GNAT family N-acetyltransferase [Chloroflexota bacterium]|nr:GNAT family N-acetyltransferase [Chloroflexota bacterium]